MIASPAAGKRVKVHQGERVGHYQLLGELRSGGMGVVYRARDLNLGREVALKRPVPGRADEPRVRRRFLHEARAAARLSHPGIVPIFEVFEDEGVPWIAMQLVAGPPLSEHLTQRGALPVAETLKHAEQLAEALCAAHQHEVLHRDIKPDNIILAADGHAMLADFGLARFFLPPEEASSATTRSESMTAPGTVVGTRGYMSPEQSLGHELDARSDIFSLGAVLYEMCTGRQAFTAPSDAGILDSVLHREPVPISRLNYEIPAELERIVRKCLAKNPDERYQGAGDLLADIRAERRRVDHESWSREHPVNHLRKPKRWPSRLVAAAGALALVVSAIAIWRAIPPTEPTSSISHNLAVATFQNLGGDSSLDYLTHGLTGTLIGRLSGLERLYVMPAKEDIQAELVLQGGVQRSGDTVRINYQIVRPRETRILGAGVVEGSLNALFSLQDQVAADVVRLLGNELALPLRLRARAAPTRSPESFDHYLRGREYLREFERAGNIDAAIDHLHESLEEDPSFPLAHAALGEVYLSKYEATRDPRWVTQAHESCQRAASLDPLLAVAHACLGLVHNGLGRYEQASAEFLRAIELDATNDTAYSGLGVAYQSLDRPEEAEKAFGRAIELHPDYWLGHAYLGGLYYRRARYPQAAAEFETAVKLSPGNSIAYTSLAAVYDAMGRREEAVAALMKSIAIRPTYKAYNNLGNTYFILRRFDDAVRAFESAARFDDSGYEAYGNLGRALTWAKRRPDEARAMFEKAIAMGRDRLRVNPGQAEVHILLAYYCAMLGHREDSTRHLESALRARPGSAEFFFWAAIVQNQLGEPDHAITSLRRSAAGGYPVSEIRAAPELDSLALDPGYKSLIQGEGHHKVNE